MLCTTIDIGTCTIQPAAHLWQVLAVVPVHPVVNYLLHNVDHEEPEEDEDFGQRQASVLLRCDSVERYFIQVVIEFDWFWLHLLLFRANFCWKVAQKPRNTPPAVREFHVTRCPSQPYYAQLGNLFHHIVIPVFRARYCTGWSERPRASCASPSWWGWRRRRSTSGSSATAAIAESSSPMRALESGILVIFFFKVHHINWC